MRALGDDLAVHLYEQVGRNEQLYQAIVAARAALGDVTNERISKWAEWERGERTRVGGGDAARSEAAQRREHEKNERSAYEQLNISDLDKQLRILDLNEQSKLTELYLRGREGGPVVHPSGVGQLLYGKTHTHSTNSDIMRVSLKRYINAVHDGPFVNYIHWRPGTISYNTHAELANFADGMCDSLPDMVPVAIHFHTARMMKHMGVAEARYVDSMKMCNVVVVTEDHVVQRGKLFDKFTERVKTRASAFILALLLLQAFYENDLDIRYNILRALTRDDADSTDELRHEWAQISSADTDCIECCIRTLHMIELKGILDLKRLTERVSNVAARYTGVDKEKRDFISAKLAPVRKIFDKMNARIETMRTSLTEQLAEIIIPPPPDDDEE
jgi:hypothetical protein